MCHTVTSHELSDCHTITEHDHCTDSLTILCVTRPLTAEVQLKVFSGMTFHKIGSISVPSVALSRAWFLVANETFSLRHSGRVSSFQFLFQQNPSRLF